MIRVSKENGMQRSWSRGTLELLPGCPACGSGDVAQRIDRKDDSGLMPDMWHICECDACGSIYLNPRPDGASLPSAYSDYLTHDTAGAERVFTNQGLAWSAVRDYLLARFGLDTGLRVLHGGRWLFRLFEPWRLKLDRFGRHLTCSRFPKPGRLLDVGCGAGGFVEIAHAMGWSASGCDPDEQVVSMCRKRGLDVRRGGAEAFMDREAGFDVVTLNQVIEHVIDPRAMLRQCEKLLRAGGTLWMGFPNPRSIGFRQFGAAWEGLHPPYHLCLPTQEVLRGWLLDAGFDQIRFQRRGAHARADWQNSLLVAQQLGARGRSRPVRWLGRILSDLTATFTSRWGEETVVIASKPVADTEK